MKKPKFIESAESIEYKKRLAEFSQLVNPKPFSSEEIETMKQNILNRRGHYNGK